MAVLEITWKKSFIGYDDRQRNVIRALGLRRLQQTVTHQDSPTIRGMINKVSHLLNVREAKEQQ